MYLKALTNAINKTIDNMNNDESTETILPYCIISKLNGGYIQQKILGKKQGIFGNDSTGEVIINDTSYINETYDIVKHDTYSLIEEFNFDPLKDYKLIIEFQDGFLEIGPLQDEDESDDKELDEDFIRKNNDFTLKPAVDMSYLKNEDFTDFMKGVAIEIYTNNQASEDDDE